MKVRDAIRDGQDLLIMAYMKVRDAIRDGQNCVATVTHCGVHEGKRCHQGWARLTHCGVHEGKRYHQGWARLLQLSLIVAYMRVKDAIRDGQDCHSL